MTPRARLRRFARDNRGSSLVEYVLAVALFLMLFFALIDFGRMLYNWNMTEKAVQIAARMAAVRPAICSTVPTSNSRGTSTAASRFGDGCDTANGLCAGEGDDGTMRVDTCLGDTTSTTATEIWARVDGLMPAGATPANLSFTYTFDPEMNFLGGPYVPMVTVEATGLTFEFVSPLLGLGNLAAGRATTGATTYSDIPFPSMSVSLPGEDLALGEDG